MTSTKTTPGSSSSTETVAAACSSSGPTSSGSRCSPDRVCLIVNPRAGAGRAGRQLRGLRRRLEAAGLELDLRLTGDPLEATLLARSAYVEGHRAFLAAGGDGTAFEVLNGALAPAIDDGAAISFGVLPLGTGNSWTRSFEPAGTHGGWRQGVEQTLRRLVEGRPRRLDVLRASTDRGDLYALSFVAFGLSSRVADLCNRRLKRLGNLGYQLGAALCALRPNAEPLEIVLRRGGRVDAWRGEVVTAGFHNVSLFGGALPIAPPADPTDGLLDGVLVERIGRFELLRTLPSLRTGEHMGHPAVRHLRAQRVELQQRVERDVQLDGEVRRLVLESVEVLPAVAEFWI